MRLCAGAVGVLFVRLMEPRAHAEQFKRHQQDTQPAPPASLLACSGSYQASQAPHTLQETSVHPRVCRRGLPLTFIHTHVRSVHPEFLTGPVWVQSGGSGLQGKCSPHCDLGTSLTRRGLHRTMSTGL